MAKDAGITMGAPWHQLQEIATKYRVLSFSSNYALYGDISARMMSVIGQFSPDQEIYSIDECFLDLSGFQHLNLVSYGGQIRQRVRRWVGICFHEGRRYVDGLVPTHHEANHAF
ncbi:Y-family DNA polymerase [Chitinimonas naiadis]